MKKTGWETVSPPLPGVSRWNRGETHAAIDLIYLAWGERRYGLHPVQKSLLAGWNYTLILRGKPVFHINGLPVQMREGEFVILPPRTVLSTSDEGTAKCQILTWIWLTAPAGGRGENAVGVPRKLIHEDTRRAMIRLHEETRREIGQADQWTSVALARIRLGLDLTLGRDGAPTRVEPLIRYKLAEDFLLQHPEIHHPVAALSDYLQISKSTVKRLFAECGSLTVKTKNHEYRMHTAKKRLGAGTHSVKEIAYDLGYNYPNDFSRAYKSFFGHAPSRRVI